MDQTTNPFLNRILSKYRVEFIAAIISGIAAVLSIYLILVSVSGKADSSDNTLQHATVTPPLSEKVTVDIEGAVQKPGTYSLDIGTRLKDILALAGGLNNHADTVHFHRQFNLAEKLNDEEKVYIPTILETNYIEINQASADRDSPGDQNPKKININKATKDELESLPGIGAATADKIIKGRPYSSLEELISQTIISKGVFEKIKELVTLM